MPGLKDRVLLRSNSFGSLRVQTASPGVRAELFRREIMCHVFTRYLLDAV